MGLTGRSGLVDVGTIEFTSLVEPGTTGKRPKVVKVEIPFAKMEEWEAILKEPTVEKVATTFLKAVDGVTTRR